jgi:hypothetical protein
VHFKLSRLAMTPAVESPWPVSPPAILDMRKFEMHLGLAWLVYFRNYEAF